MIQKKLLKLAVVALTAGMFVSAQSAQTKEIPQTSKEMAADAAQVKTVPADQDEVAMMKKQVVGEMQKIETDGCSCNKPACNKETKECPAPKPCKTPCEKKEPAPCVTPEKKCNKCEPKPCTKGAAKSAVEN